MQYFWGFSEIKMNNLGHENFVDIFLVITKRDGFKGHFICTAVFSQVRLGLVQHGVMGLKWACGVNLTNLQWVRTIRNLRTSLL